MYHELKIAVEVLEEEGSLLCSQAFWGTGGYHPLRIVVEVLEEEESLHCEVDSGKGMSLTVLVASSESATAR